MSLVFPDPASKAAAQPASDAAQVAAQGVMPQKAQQPTGRLVFPQERERTWGQAAADTGVQLAEGVNTILGAVPSLVAPDSGAAGFFRDNAEFWRKKQSAPLQVRLDLANVAIDKAGEDGVIAQVLEAASQYSSDPGLAARFVVTNLPSMIPSIGAAKLAQVATAARTAAAVKAGTMAPAAATAAGAAAATTAGGVTNAALNAGGARGEAFEDIKRTLLQRGYSEEEANQRALDDSRGPAAVGAVTGFISGRTGLESALFGVGGTGNVVRRGVGKTLAELGGEQLEELSPKVATNFQAGQYDNRPLTQDVGRTIVETAIGSGPQSVVAGVSEAMRGDPAAPTGTPAPAGQPPVPAPVQAPPAPPAAPAGTIVPPTGGPGAPGAAVPPLDPANIPPELDAQNRDRTRPASVLQMQSIAQNPDYLRLGPSRSPDTGAPMVFAQGDDTGVIPDVARGRQDIAVMSDGQRVPFTYAVVDASLLQPSNFADGTPNPLFGDETPGLIKALNNGRSAGLRAAWAQGTASGYGTDLEADTDQHGVSPEAIRSTRNPVLVRLYSQADNKPNMAARSQGQGLGMSPGELARQDAPLIDGGLLAAWQGGDVADTRNLDFVRGFVGRLQGTGQDLAGMMTQAGTLSPDGRKRIQAALAQAAYGDADLIGEMFDSTDTDIKAIGEALKLAAPEWADMRDSARSGAIDPAADITPALLGAVSMVRRARQQRQSLSDLARQSDITTGQTPDPMVLGALRLLYGGEFLTRPMGRDRMADFLREYTRLAKGITADAGLFGDAPAPMDVLTALTKETATDGQQQQPGAAAGTTQQPGTGNQQPAGGGDPRGDAGAGGSTTVRPGDNQGGAQPAAGGAGPLANTNPAGQAPVGPQGYEARREDRRQRISQAKTADEAQAVLQEEYQDNERHFEGTTGLEKAARGLKQKLADEAAKREREADNRRRLDAGEWVEDDTLTQLYRATLRRGSTQANAENRKRFDDAMAAARTANPDREYEAITDRGLSQDMDREVVRFRKKAQAPATRPRRNIFTDPTPNPPAAPAPAPAPIPAGGANTVFTEDAAAAARARLKAKLGRLNAGIDPETMLDGITLAGYHIERGARTFAAYARAMVDDLGDAVKPYLVSWYLAVRNDPRAADFKADMDKAGAVEDADLDALLAGPTKAAPTTAPAPADVVEGDWRQDRDAPDGEGGWIGLGYVVSEVGSYLDVSIRNIKNIGMDGQVVVAVRQIRLMDPMDASLVGMWQWNSARLNDLDGLGIDMASFFSVSSARTEELFGDIDPADGDALWGRYGPEIMEMLRQRPAAAPSTQRKPTSALPAPGAAAPSLSTAEGRMALAQTIADRFIGGDGFKTIIEARKFIADATGEKIEAGTQAAKLADEAIEMAVVLAGREIVQAARAQGRDDGVIYDRLVSLYGLQPTLGVRTSTSVREQAYSTPVPLAFLASRRAQVAPDSTVGEPTGGNTMLLIEVDPERATVNELNADRAANARALGFTVTTHDAARHQLAPEKSLDRVIANPPFGAVKGDDGETVIFPVAANYGTREIDHAIAFKALDAIKDDGSAVLILGGVDASNDEAIREGYRGKSKREFYFRLYGLYNVVDHFTVDGGLYSKQGAGYPVDVVVIRGRGKATRAMPAAELPKRYDTWEALKKEKLDGSTEAGADGVVPTGSGAGTGRGDGAQGQQPGTRGLVDGPGGQGAGDGGQGAGPGRGGDVGGEGAGTPGAEGQSGRGRGAGGAQPGASQRPDAGRDGATQAPVPGEGDRRGGGNAQGDGGNRPGDVGGTGSGQDQRVGSGPGNDDLDGMFNDVLQQELGGRRGASTPGGATPRPAGPGPGTTRTPGQAAASAARNTAQGLTNAIDGLGALFGANSPGRLGSGPTFDEETYAKAKPLFQAALANMKDAAADIREAMRAIVRMVLDKFGEVVTRNMQPYVVRFVRDLMQPNQETPNDRRGQEQETETQVAYTPESGAASVGTLVPRAMRDSIAASLKRVADSVGNIDEFVAEKLGFDPETLRANFSAEQVDALALSIMSAEAGKGFIIGDQTGIGKGRVVAAMLRYAMRNDKVPVFVTEKPNLYADMIRDLDDIGMGDELRLQSSKPLILVTNSSEPIPYVLQRKIGEDVVETEHSLRAPGAGADLEKFFDKIAGDGDIGPYKVVFTTYSQLQTVKGKMTARMRMVQALAQGGYMVFDESHNAGGTQITQARTKKDRDAAKAGETTTGRSGFVRQLVRTSFGSFFSSATYAKRPDVMDLYSSTNMMLAVDKPADLAPAIMLGGVPMQQIVATMLTEDGQYIRRERTFAGVTYDTRPMSVDRQTAENMAQSMRMILAFSRAKEAAVKSMQKEFDREGAMLGVMSGEKTSVQGANFGAIMHNLIDQMLLSLKAQESVDYAIERLKAGEKVVLTVANTMGSFLDDYAKDFGVRPGEPVMLSFADLYQRYLEKQRMVRIKRPGGPKEGTPYRLTDKDLGPVLVDQFNFVGEFIRGAGFGAAPISPIDYMHQRMRDAGYKSDEITGRTVTVSYGSKVPTLASRRANIKQRLAAIRGFNGGTVDVLILNQSGATGLSLHASSKFKDKRKRHMVIVQAEKNIDTFMQMLGRVHRTGQIIPPAYTQAMASIPAEARPAAITLKKMASLNANTTASRKSAVTAEGVVDFMNDYGGQVAAEFLLENPEVHMDLGGQKVLEIPAESTEADEDLIRKLTGYLPILPIDQQEAVYRDLVDRYNELLARENAMGSNKLEAAALDLGAKTEKREQVTAKRESPVPSRFAEPAFMEQVDVARTVKPLTKAEVDEAVAQALAGKTPDAVAEAMARTIQQQARDYADRVQALRVKQGADTDSDKRDFMLREIQTIEAQKNILLDHIRSLKIGQAVTVLDQNQTATYGVITSVVGTGKTKNPVAGSGWKFTIALANGEARSITLSASQINKQFTIRPERGPVLTLDPRTNDVASMSIRDLFDAYGTGNIRREKRWMVTGNLLAGFASFPGQIVTYTKDDGSTAQGVLMRRGFDYEKRKGDAKATFQSADMIRRFFTEAGRNAMIGTPDGVLRVKWMGGSYPAEFETSSSKRAGGTFFLDRGLTDALGRDFTKSGQVMRVAVREEEMMSALVYLMTERDDVSLEAKTNKDIARRLLGLPDATDAQGNRSVREEGAVYRVRERDDEARDIPADLFPDTLESLEPTAADPRVHRKRRNPGGVPVAAADEKPTAVLAVREDPAMPGVYHHSSQLVQVGIRDLPVSKVTNWMEASSALASLGKFAVEHLDALVTDKNGKPLAVVGAFKGAEAAAPLYPSVVLAEALRIEGAARVWGVHNHPSGNQELSIADKRMSELMRTTFEPSSVQWMGMAAIGEGRFQAYDGKAVTEGVLLEGKTVARVPIVERTIQRMNVGMPILSTTAEAKRVVGAWSNNKPGLLFLSSPNQVTAWVPVKPDEMKVLRKDGRFDRLMNSATQAGARGVLISNPNGVMNLATLDNIASALRKADVRVLDVIDPSQPKTLSEQGLEPNSHKPVFSRTDMPAKGMTLAAAQRIAAGAVSAWARKPRLVVARNIQDPAVPQALRDEDKRQRAGGATGEVRGTFFQGAMYVFSDHLGSDLDVIETVFHEGLGHYGLRGLFGNALDAVLDMVNLARPDLMRPKAAEYGADLRKPSHRRYIAEEVLASMAQNEPTLGFVRRAIAAVRTWLRTNVPGLEKLRLTDAEIIRNFILPARQFVMQGQAQAGAGRDMAAAFMRAQPVDSEAFKRWTEGLPVQDSFQDRYADRGVFTLYHATTSDFSEFKPGGLNVKDSGPAIWLAPTPATGSATFRVGSEGAYRDGANVMPVYAKLKSPLVLDSMDMLMWAREVYANSEFPQLISAKTVADLKADGYDSVILDSGMIWNKPAESEVLVFEPTQIKSAIGNSGAFDPTNPDIRFSRGTFSDVNRMSAEQVQAEIKALMPRVDEAYEAGNLALAERLDARLETLMEALESNFVELEEDQLTAVDLLNPVMAARIAEGEQGDAEADVVRNLANTWKELSDGRWGYGNMTASEKAELLRGMLDDYAWRHGGLKPRLTDRAILDAAEDAFKAVYGMRTEQLARIRRGRDLSMVRPASTPMFARGPASTLTAAQRAENILNTPVMQARPLDRVFHTASRLTGLEYVTKRVYGRAGALLERFVPERVKAGVVSDYGVPEAVIDMRVTLQGRQRQQLRKAGELLDKLANLTREESRIAYEWMNMDGSDPRAYLSMMQGLPEESVKVLQEVQRMIDDLSKEAVRLGQLDARSYERNKFAYLRRTYDRYLEELTPQQQRAHQKATRILGDQYRMRGLVEPVDMAKIKAGDPDWWGRKEQEGKGDAGLVNQKFIKLERLKPTGAGTIPLPGMTGKADGKVLEVVYWPAERTVPAKYSEWRRNEVFEVRDVKGGKVVLWRDFTKDEREAMGEVDEARFAIARTLQRMVHDVEVGRYLENLSQKFAKADGDEIDGVLVEASESWHRAFKPSEWVKVPDSKITGTSVHRYGKLAGKYLPGPIWNDVRFAVNGPTRPLGEVYSKILSAWKVSKTALTPAVHMNNVMANLVMADWHDVGAAHIAKALRLILAAHQRDGKGALGRVGNVAAGAGIADREAALAIMNRYRDAGGDIGSWATQEIAREQMAPLLDAVLEELGRDGDASVQGQIGVMAALQNLLHLKLPEAWAAFKGSKPATVVGREAQSMIDLYQAEDDVFRLAAWLAAKEQGMDDLRAGREARRSFLDYDINAPWVDAMRRSAWPFIAFTYRAVPMLFEIAGKRPHKILKLATLLGALNMLGVAMSGDDEGDEERRRRMLPEEKAGRVWGVVPKLIRMPWNDPNGSPVYLDIRRFIPVGDVVDTGSTQAALPVPPGLMPGGPLVILGEVLMNKSAFTGKPITLGTDTPAESSAKVFEHLYKGFAPNLPGLPGTYATDALVNAGTGKTDAFGRQQSMAQAMASSVGVKLGSYPEDVLRRNTLGRAGSQRKEIETVMNGLQRQRNMNGISEAEYERKMEVQREKLRKLNQETREKVAQ